MGLAACYSREVTLPVLYLWAWQTSPYLVLLHHSLRHSCYRLQQWQVDQDDHQRVQHLGFRQTVILLQYRCSLELRAVSVRHQVGQLSQRVLVSPEDFEVQQPKRSAKKRRISGGQTIDEQADPVAALSHVRKWVMENIRDRIAFNWVTEEFCQMERLHMLEVVAVANKAYTEVLKSFPDFLTGSSVTVALVDTLAKAWEKHTLVVLEGIEWSHENWVWLKVQRSNAETWLLACTGQLYECLLAEAVHLSPTAFSNVLNLSMGLLPPIQHTMPPIQQTIVLTTQVPTLRVLPSMGINFSVASGAGDGGGAGSDRAQQADDNIPEDCDAGPDKDSEGSDSGDCDVIILGSSTHRAARHSVIPFPPVVMTQM